MAPPDSVQRPSLHYFLVSKFFFRPFNGRLDGSLYKSMVGRETNCMRSVGKGKIGSMRSMGRGNGLHEINGEGKLGSTRSTRCGMVSGQPTKTVMPNLN